MWSKKYNQTYPIFQQLNILSIENLYIYSIQIFLNEYYTQSRLLFLVSLPQMEMCITIIQGKLTSFILSLPSDHRDQEHQDTLVQK